LEKEGPTSMSRATLERLRLSDLKSNPRALVRAASSTRPAVWVTEVCGKRMVVKDFSDNGFLFRNTVGRFLIWRESRAYGILEGIEGVPECYGTLQGLSLLTEEIPGNGMEKWKKHGRLPEGFFNDLHGLLEGCHHRGIAHCDLKRSANVILGHDGRPYIIDWAASISEKEFRFYPLNRIYRRFVLDDHMAVIKLQLRHEPETVTLEDRERYAHRGIGEKIVRSLRNRLRSLLQKIA
jgi:serine/threonine protein kinase